MTTYKYLSADIVAVIDEDGISRMSGLASALVPEGATIEPADPLPNPRIAEIYAALSQIDSKSIRAIRENDTARIAEWELQAEMLRAELATL